jgi:radical SAM superfamily enzyme YgiQ (UPF0313 family)
MILIINSAGISPREVTGSSGSREQDPEDTGTERGMHLNLLPTASAMVVSHLREAGYDVIHRDLNRGVSHFIPQIFSSSDFEQWLRENKKSHFVKKYLDLCLEQLALDWEKIKLIGISIISFIQYPFAISLARELNRLHPGIPICLGGTYVTLSSHDFPGYISYIVRGDGGGPVCHLAAHIIKNEAYDENFPGLHKVVEGQAPDENKNHESADSEKPPYFQGIDLNDYIGYMYAELFYGFTPPEPFLVLNYRTSKGCVMKCSFCTARKLQPMRYKSTKKVIKEMVELTNRYSEYNVNVIFTDNSINLDLTHLNEILDGLIENHLDLKWMSFCNIRHMSPELWDKIARSGCRSFFWGMEGATPRMRKIFNKPFSDQLAEECLWQAMNRNIFSIVSLIYNAPGETREDFEGLLNLLEHFSHYKPFVIPNLCEFSMDENSNMYDNPQQYNIEILHKDNKSYGNERGRVAWKDIHMNWTAFEKQRTSRNEQVNQVLKNLWDMPASGI